MKKLFVLALLSLAMLLVYPQGYTNDISYDNTVVQVDVDVGFIQIDVYDANLIDYDYITSPVEVDYYF